MKMSARILPFLASFAALALADLLSAQPSTISIDSRVDKSTITIGDLIKYTVEVVHSPDIEVEMPELAENLGAFEIRDYTVHDPLSRDNSIVDRVDYIISTFEVGEFEIPPLVFHYAAPGDSTKHELATQKIDIVVKSMLPSEAEDIRDIKAPLEFPRDYRKIIIWSSVAVAFLVLLLVSIYIWRRRKAGKGILPQKVEPPRPAHEITIEELDALKASSLLAEGRLKAFYIELSEIIRRYIEGRYFIVALEMTTYELLQELRAAEVEAENVELIQDFLEVCDLVKFARYRPTETETEVTIQKAFDLVERTKLIYEVAGVGENREEDGPPETVAESAEPREETEEEIKS
ncbi:MAG: hypothetical protein E2O78_01765 [Caldithrix sp.]|nr:MAG: hypothetical protein E2O78_01765 [Caldithrix sp.]